MSRATEAWIDTSALRHNLLRVKSFAPNASVMAMVKSHAYGHGLVRAAQAMDQADAFGVAFFDEALELREAGIKQPITLLEGFFSSKECQAAQQQGCMVVIHHEEQLHILEKTRLAGPLSVWLKIDTGMHRLGFLPEESAAAFQRLNAIDWVKNPVGVMTHFADADDPSKPTTQVQLDCFNMLTKDWSVPKSVANSAGIVAWPRAHFDCVRPGIMLYGASPMLGTLAEDFDLKPVMTLQAKLMVVHTLKQGDAVGYGGAWTCPEAMPVGVISIGYGDGYPRHAKSGTPVLVNGVQCPLMGRVSMDMITVDLRHCPQARVGDPVVLWGAGLPVERIADWSETIAYELLCKVTARVKVNIADNIT